jgi:hypothetical protein
LLMAEAPPASARDTPAAPITGKAIFRRFRFAAFFACAIVEPSYRQVSTSFVAFFGCIAQPKRRLEGALFDTNLGAPGKLATSKLAKDVRC